jgi:hypothetical protein
LGVGVIGFEHCAHKIMAPLIFTPEVNGFRQIPNRVGDDDMAALSILRFRNKLKIQNGPIHYCFFWQVHKKFVRLLLGTSLIATMLKWFRTISIATRIPSKRLRTLHRLYRAILTLCNRVLEAI